MSETDDISAAKERFSRNALWGISIRSSFQRSYIYKKDANDKLKIAFKNELQELVFEIVYQYENGSIDEKTHLSNIDRIKKWTRKFGDLFVDGEMKYGICQKLLNVFLKELWCAGKIQFDPPHLPVDRLIQEKLKLRPIINWTQIETEKEYMGIIERIRRIADSKDLSLAEIELLAYNDLVEEGK
jgi:hypothetical protein